VLLRARSNITSAEYRLMVFPVAGRRQAAVGELGAAAPLRLTESKPAGETPILIYEPAAA
jgi:hypothetical protein